MRRRSLTRLIAGLASAAALLLGGAQSALAVFVPGDTNGNATQVSNAVAAGRAYLISQQGAPSSAPPGCWQSQGVIAGVTALNVLALVNSVQGGYANLDAPTKASVDSGILCLLARVQPDGTINDPSTPFFKTYNTSISIWALSVVPSTPAISSAISGGRGWLIANQANDGSGRADTGGNINNGGWYYEGGLTPSFVEHSNSSFALQGLEATGGLPAATSNLAQGFWICLQRMTPYPTAACASGGGPNDGGFIYSHQINKGGTETSATGSGSFSMSLTGVAAGSTRINATISYLDASIGVAPCDNNTHTVDSLLAGWVPTGTLRHYTVWANFKAHVLAGIADSISDMNNWYYKLANCLVTEQVPNGQWPPSGREDALLATAFSMLTLEKVTPEQLITKVAGVPFSGTEGTNSCGPVATFTDPDNKAVAGDYAATIDWGDSSSSAGTVMGTPPGSGNFTVSGCHTYAEEGTYTIKVTITDVDNAANTATVFTKATIGDAALAAKCAIVSPFIPQTYTGPTAVFTDASSTGTLSDFTTPPGGATINWGDGFSSAGTVSGAGGNAPYTVSGSHTYSSTGPVTITTNITDFGGSKTSASCTETVFAFATSKGAAFVVGDLTVPPANLSLSAYFWGSQWWTMNPMSGPTRASFKGFAGFEDNPLGLPAVCGGTWTTDTGNATPPPPTIPAVMAVIVSSTVTQNGSVLSGDIKHVVFVKTNPGYAPNPGSPGTGTIIGFLC
jgi:hypothetical protein